ncbi:hypothetical protein EV137_5579 [Kribbella pratensis]|uniref:Uncharacterized protein n=1 Tax=Kribbella pratensis TaxID=2512112 RepID=A0ABY2FA97_9ACTN|nr:hypothetical protein [Kribbella pratensis]TDW87499.1 hypothetical protein EV137_5579 [Kribbella pratensis]
MPTESRTTSAVAALSVAVAVVGHALVGGGGVPLGVVPPLVALAAVCWLLGEYLAGELLLTGLVLAGAQLFVHVALDSVTMHHGMSIASSLMMTGTHLGALLAGVLLIGQAHRWVHRVRRVFARLLPELPMSRPVRRVDAEHVFFAAWTPSGSRLGTSVSGRGPPGVRVTAF